jgi:6-phosphogluconolactonase
MRTPRIGAASIAAALLFLTGVTSMSAAKTFVYVSNAQDGNIDAYILDNGALTPIGKTEAAKMVMPMAVSPNKKTLYAVIRSQPVRVLSFAIDPANGKLTQKASAPLPDSMPYVSTDRSGRFLFTASYGGDKIAVSPIGENGLVEAEAIQVIPTGRNAHSPSTARPASSRPTSLRQPTRTRVTALATWFSRRTTRTSTCSTSFPGM